MLVDANIHEFKSYLDRMKGIQKEHINRYDRKGLTRLLRKLAPLDSVHEMLTPRSAGVLKGYTNESAIAALKNSIKRGNQSIVMDAINWLGNKFLEKIQLESDIAFAKKRQSGPKIKKTAEDSKNQSEEDGEEGQEGLDKSEGNRVRQACNGLRSLSRLIELKNTINNLESSPEQKKGEDDAETKISSEHRNSVARFIKDLCKKKITSKNGDKGFSIWIIRR